VESNRYNIVIKICTQLRDSPTQTVALDFIKDDRD